MEHMERSEGAAEGRGEVRMGSRDSTRKTYEAVHQGADPGHQREFDWYIKELGSKGIINQRDWHIKAIAWYFEGMSFSGS